MYAWRGKRWGKGTRGELTVPLNAGDPHGAYTHTLAPVLRIRTPHSVDIPATDGATIDPDDAHTPLSRSPCVFVLRILLKSTQGEGATT